MNAPYAWRKPRANSSVSSQVQDNMIARGRAPSLAAGGDVRGYRSVPGSADSPENTRKKINYSRPSFSYSAEDWQAMFKPRTNAPTIPGISAASSNDAMGVAQNQAGGMLDSKLAAPNIMPTAPSAALPMVTESTAAGYTPPASPIDSAIANHEEWFSRQGIPIPSGGLNAAAGTEYAPKRFTSKYGSGSVSYGPDAKQPEYLARLKRLGMSSSSLY